MGDAQLELPVGRWEWATAAVRRVPLRGQRGGTTGARAVITLCRTYLAPVTEGA